MLAIYFLFFSTWVYLNYKRHGFSPSTFLLGVFWLTSIASMTLVYGYQTYIEERILWYAIIFHVICLFFFLYPVVKFGNLEINKFKMPPIKYIKILSWILIVFSISSIVVSTFKIQVAFSYDDLNEARALHNKGELNENADRNIFTYIGDIGQNLSIFPLFLSFYLFIFYPKLKLMTLLLFISSFAIVFNNLAIMGRDGIIRWFLFFIFVFSFFRKYISPKLKKQVFLLFIIGAVPIITIFYKITQARFINRDKDPFYYIVDYTGQPFIYFSYNFKNFMEGTAGGRMNFPLLFPDSERASINNLNDRYSADYNLNTFPTFVGSFYFDLGLIKTFILGVVFFLYFSYYFRRRKIYNFSQLIVFITLYHVFMLGVFYYVITSTTSNKSILAIIIFSLFVEFHFKREHRLLKRKIRLSNN